MENIFTQHLCQEYQDNGDEHDWNGGNFFHHISLFGKNTLYYIYNPFWKHFIYIFYNYKRNSK